MIRKLLNDKNGSMHLLLIFIICFMIGASLIVSEAFRINSINEHLNDELNRAANISIQAAMYDSYRQDVENKFNEESAEQNFYDYLYNEMQLDSHLRKYSSGKLVYTVIINELNIDGETGRLNLKATAFVPSLFGFGQDFEVPINITSRNIRVDGI